MKTILFVDDEPNVLAAFQRQLRKQFVVETALGPIEGLNALKNPDAYAVVVADMRMPEMNGVEFLARVKEAAPDVVRMMLTGNADQTTAMDAVNEGNIFRFLNKPCPQEKLTQALEDGLRQHQLITVERDLLENTLSGSIKVLTEILSLAEPKIFGQTESLRANIRLLAGHMDLVQTWDLEIAALLSQIGYITLPPEVALKARLTHALSSKEQEMLNRLPSVGANLIAQIPRLEEVSKIILYQNKYFNGAGFPDDTIAGHNLPIGARMLKILLDLAQLEGRGIDRATALNHLVDRKGFYDPQILNTVVACLKPVIDKTAAPVTPPLMVTLPTLRVGHTLISDIQTSDGILIVSAGNRITPALMQRLRNFSSLSGIKEPIYVEAWQ